MEEEKIYTTAVLKMAGLDDDQIQEEFSEFFEGLTQKYPNQFGVGAYFMKRGSDAEAELLKIARL